MGKRYIRIYFEELFSSDSWKARSSAQQAQAIQGLLESVGGGRGIPKVWERVAELRTLGAQPRGVHWPPALMPHKEAWERIWLAERGIAYSWSGGDRLAIRRLHSRGDLAQFNLAIGAAISDAWLRSKLTLGMIEKRWNELLSSALGKTPPPPAGWKCPRCGGDSGRIQGQNICIRCYGRP